MRIRLSAVTVYLASTLVFAWGLHGQTGQKRPSFEVASVKAMTDSDPNSDLVPRRLGDQVTMHSVPLQTIIAWAYRLGNPDYQLVPGIWEKILFSEDCDIQALAPGLPSDDELRLMFQALLEDRFQLKIHKEMRDLEAYDLVVARGGSKLVPAPPRAAKHSVGFGGISSWAAFRNDGKHLVGVGASMEEMVVVLTRQMRAPVRDRTGIAGVFDFDVAFSTGVDSSEKPVLATAIHDLGLNLEKTRGSFEVMVIDRLERPSGN